MLNETYTLNNGITIPRLGLGTWFIEDDDAAQAVRDAAAIGYRHFDTAQAYGNERGVGGGIRTCGIPRHELFVTTKLAAEIKTLDEARQAIGGSLQTLGLDAIDMMIIHSPQPWAEFRKGEHFLEGNLQAWRALEEALQAGKIRAIGLSNFEQVDLDNILENGSVRPAVNQILAHVSNTPLGLIDYIQSNGILVEAYSPFGHGEILRSEVLVSMAAAYGVSTAQLAIRYCLQLGMLPLPKTANPAHMRSNAEVDFDIGGTDMETLKKVAPIGNYGEASVFPVYGDNARSA
ncbi:aldo/keto reductase [Novosphingobium album (ex Hu et al. 2023)]|uniref:Aldo/keto reductase n=1 Tax=Novosphingobium album (ex Hu et al. 2023) TaxID=2930093 RepID=A0ABT0B6B9_9SPHN|nr:aldo/keto reductase [Novosphingobium album (ex Hu et al. 2023)]MCJ2180595.1 aldo/keto reductase [Novosphingobium album (ex Hu et al. 2023)]